MRLLICAATAAALVAAAAAFGSDGGGGLAACAKTATGQLRLDTGDGCGPSEQSLQLGTGRTTAADERYYVAPNLRDPSTFLPLGNSQAQATAVVTMHVAAGNYAVASQITYTGSGGSGDVPCILLDSAGVIHGYAESTYDASARTVTMTGDGALTLAADTDLSLRCWNIAIDGPATVGVRAADITTKSVDLASIEQETH